MLNLLNESNDFKFVTSKSNIFNNQSNVNYSVGIENIHNTEVWKSNPCDSNNTYILVKGDTTVIAAFETQVAFKCKCKCILTIDGTTINDAENLDLVMSM